MRKSSIVFSLLGPCLLAAAAHAKSPLQRVALGDSVPSVLARSSVTGAPDPGQIVHFTIGLAPRYPAELQAFCDSVSNPASPIYRQFMTPQQVGENFGASASDVANVTGFLKSEGIKIELSAPNRMAMICQGTVSQLEQAFGTKIENYKGPDESGVMVAFRANATPLTVPSGISKVLTCVSGLSTYGHPHPRSTLTPPLARGLYNTAPSYALGIQGQGRKIGYTNFDNVSLADANTFVTTFSLPIPGGGIGTNVHHVVIGSGHNMTTAGTEGNIDLQMELSAAPLADIYIYDDVSGDLLGVNTKEASDNVADIISESYGWAQNYYSAATWTSVHNEHLTMTADGQTYLVASGDNGTRDMTNDPYPDPDPEITNVGGTIATVNGTTGARISEVAWSGSGGGWSTTSWGTTNFNLLPSWQHGNNVPTNINFRLVPDIALQGGDVWIVIINGAENNGYIGTSFASPFCASGLASLEQRLAALGLPSRLGRINDLVYSENGRSDVWYDITTGGSNGTLPNGATGSPAVGWDFVTGWGAPNFDGWYTAISSRPVSGTVTLQNYNPSPAGVSVTVQLYQAGTSTLVDTKTTTLDSGGNFTATSQAPVGNYDVYVKAPHWLRKKVTNKTFGASGVSGLSFSLINGDINGDNTISLADFGQLKAAYGSVPGNSNWNANADLDGNGSVGLSDFGILKAHYGMGGD